MTEDPQQMYVNETERTNWVIYDVFNLKKPLVFMVYIKNMSAYPSKHETLAQRWYSVGPTS